MSDSWQRAGLALQLLALDPFGLGGAQVRMRAGPQRDAVLDALKGAGVKDRLPPTISDEDLLGGLDLTATLAAGHKIMRPGYFATARKALLPMAERCSPGLAGRLVSILDNGRQCCLVCLDEGIEPDEQTPLALRDRLPFLIAPDGRMPEGWSIRPDVQPSPAAGMGAEQLETLVRLADSLGIDSLRTPLQAVAVAKAHARLHGRSHVIREDIDAAAALVFAHRATRLPAPEEEVEPETQQPSDPISDAPQAQDTEATLPDELLIEAVKAALPNGILGALQPQGGAQQKGEGAGAKQSSFKRGRPLPSRPGRPDGRARIDLVATLRTAAPWQKLRPRSREGNLAIHGSDIRLRKYESRADRLLIFTVDASGSAAVARLGETKGAVEMLLADAYASRDHVALIAFRGESAELLLPPTRSLVQTKRRLAALPGGGGTPLAAGLLEAARLAEQARGRGMTPTLILLTDGRANVALNGAKDRNAAAEDANQIVRQMRQTQSLVIDTAKRPSPALQSLSNGLGGTYIAMPRADAQGLQSTVTAVLG